MLREAAAPARYPPPSPYLRRASPPGSPAPRGRCCFEHPFPANSRQRQESLFCCCYTCPTEKSTSLFAAVGVCCLVLGYTVVGAFLFMALEDGDRLRLYLFGGGGGGGGERDTAVAASKNSPAGVAADLRSDTVDRLWSITENLNILYRENWTRLAAEEVLLFQEALFKALKGPASGHYRAGYYRKHDVGHHKWSFSSSFLYSLTLITTIGYGSVSPRTSWGKLATILYALVGIPLMLLYLSTTGDLLARAFRRTYARICGINTQKAQCQCINTIRVPASLCLIVVFAYICSGAVIFHRLENWSLLEGSYFCFTSLGTIGFGDLLPGGEEGAAAGASLSLCVCSAYILAGMALVAMCFTLLQDEVVALLRHVNATCARGRLAASGADCP